ncbi:MAG: hypothetical protein KGQ49_02465 [Verrucomicrobia bacterium]|nr:hypothetical protein [Verrucomicrobiota bacterium]MBU6446245.1 hypothetical protein [Verrucomicrobiota bacterium]MDE3047783.1 hypothetical protein [Verrucomicrobiota bacterium]
MEIQPPSLFSQTLMLARQVGGELRKISTAIKALSEQGATEWVAGYKRKLKEEHLIEPVPEELEEGDPDNLTQEIIKRNPFKNPLQ